MTKIAIQTEREQTQTCDKATGVVVEIGSFVFVIAGGRT